MDSSFIHRLLEDGFLDKRELVEEGVRIVNNLVTVGGVARWEVRRYLSTSFATDETPERECAAYLMRNEIPHLADLMPRLIGTIGSDTLLIEATVGRPMWESGSASVAAGVLATVHRESRGIQSKPFPLPWILRCLDVDAPQRIWDHCAGPLRKIGNRRPTVSALRRLRAAWCPDVFIHGNASLHNVVMRFNGRLQFVNWGSSGRGDPAWDLAALCLRPVLLRTRRSSAVSSWWAQILNEIATCVYLHAKVYGHSLEPRTIVGMMGALVLQSTIGSTAQRGESDEIDAELAGGCELLENAEMFAMALERTIDDGTPMPRGDTDE